MQDLWPAVSLSWNTTEKKILLADLSTRLANMLISARHLILIKFSCKLSTVFPTHRRNNAKFMQSLLMMILCSCNNIWLSNWLPTVTGLRTCSDLTFTIHPGYFEYIFFRFSLLMRQLNNIEAKSQCFSWEI